MNSLSRLIAASLLACISTLHAEEGVADLPIGAPAPDFSLPGIDGKTHKLGEYNDGKLLMIFFTSNHCPTSHGVEARLKKFLPHETVRQNFEAFAGKPFQLPEDAPSPNKDFLRYHLKNVFN